MKKLALHWQIIIGMVTGIIVGLTATIFGGNEGKYFVIDWIKPFGTIFINLLKLMAIPLILSSLVKGVSDLRDISSLSKMGGKTIFLYIITTVFAIILGLSIVNIIKPGNFVKEETRKELMVNNADNMAEKLSSAEAIKERGPLQPLVDIVPDNIFDAMSSNMNMLQVIFFALLLGVCIILLPEEKSRPLKDLFDSFNEVIMKMVDLIMLSAPIGVFALLAALIAESPSWDIFVALGIYSLCVILGLTILLFIVYPLLVWIFTGRSFRFFQKGIAPAQLVAFSTSSSAATLPVTMERVEEHLGVDKKVVSFVCPVGATISMDGTSLYQAIAAVFVAQAFGDSLTFNDQLVIIAMAVLASIGSAPVPGAGLLMLVIVLEAVGINPIGLALILAIDRPLDMMRTVVNITGDGVISMMVAKSEGLLHDVPAEKKWDDHYKKDEQ